MAAYSLLKLLSPYKLLFERLSCCLIGKSWHGDCKLDSADNLIIERARS